MAKQTINIGSAANDGTGSTLRAAFDITNDNFTELYGGTGGLFHKIEGTNFTGSLLIGHSTTGTLSSADNNVGVGISALDALTSGDSNVAIGNAAGSAITTGSANILLGRAAGDALVEGSNNVAIGHFALSAEDGHGRNVGIGFAALNVQNAGADAYNVAIGYDAGKSVSTGVQNTIIGGQAGDALTTGGLNTAIGYEALSGEDTGGRNTAVGWRALKALNIDTVAYNTAFGFSAGEAISTGTQNVILGGLAGDALTEGSNNIIIGYNAAASAVDVSNEVTIGNSSVANVRIPADSTLKIGASGDLQLEHLSSNSFIKNTAVGDLYIENQVDDGDVIFRSDDGSGGLATYFQLDGGDTNIKVLKPMQFANSVRAYFGGSNNSEIMHNGTDMSISNFIGDIKLINYANDKDIIFQSDDGSGGVTEYFRVDGGDVNVLFSKMLKLSDNVELRFGGGNDIKIYHDTSNSYIKTGTEAGNLIIEQNTDNADIIFKSDDGSGSTTEYFRVDGGAEAIIISKNVQHADNVKAYFGNAIDLEIYHDGTNSVLNNTNGHLQIFNNADDKDIVFLSDDGSNGNTEYFRVDGGITKTVFVRDTKHEDSKKALFGDQDDLQIQHDGTDSTITNITGDLYIKNSADNKRIYFQSDDGSGGNANYFYLDGNASATDSLITTFPDDSRLTFGTGRDLQIYHDASNSYIQQSGTGDLYIQNGVNDKDIILRSDDGSGGQAAYITLDGSEVETLFSKTTHHSDNIQARFGDAGDLRIYHDGSNSFIADTGTGKLKVLASQFDVINAANTEFMAEFIENAEVRLYYNNSKKFETTNTGVTITGNSNFADNGKAIFGDSDDLQIYHTGSASIVGDFGTGNLSVRGDNLQLHRADGSQRYFQGVTGGAATMYHAGNPKLETTSIGVNIQSVPEHADNSAASTAGLAVGDVYRTGDLLKIRH